MSQAVMAETPPAATAQQALSRGCTTLRGPLTDGMYTSKSYPSMHFVAGEQITIEARPYAALGTETTITLLEGSDVVAVASGALEYTIPVSGSYSFYWFASGNAVWSVNCAPPRPET